MTYQELTTNTYSNENKALKAINNYSAFCAIDYIKRSIKEDGEGCFSISLLKVFRIESENYAQGWFYSAQDKKIHKTALTF